MLITKLFSKIHRAEVTGSDLHYEGSIALDQNFIDYCRLQENEKVDIYNINNGHRFSTYIIPAPPGSKTVSLNGAAARLVQKGDLIIICSYRHFLPEENHTPIVLSL